MLSDDRVSLTSKFMTALECFSQPDQDFKVSFNFTSLKLYYNGTHDNVKRVSLLIVNRGF